MSRAGNFVRIRKRSRRSEVWRRGYILNLVPPVQAVMLGTRRHFG